MAMYNGFVYLAKSDTGHYKIGRSKNPYSRIKHFDTIMPVKVEIVHYFPCDDPVRAEREYHEYANRYGERVAGEWFKFEEDIAAAFCNITHYLNGISYMNREVFDGMFVQDCCYEHMLRQAEKVIATGRVASPNGKVYDCVLADDSNWVAELGNWFNGGDDATVS